MIAARIFTWYRFLVLVRLFAAALVADVIPAQRRGEGIGYFGLGSTVAMAVAPALGVMLLTDFSANILFFYFNDSYLFCLLLVQNYVMRKKLLYQLRKSICLSVISCVNMVQEYLQY